MKIPIEQIEFEDWASTYEAGARHNGKPFTGKAYGHIEDVYVEWGYKNGRAHGRWLEIKKNTEEIIANGFYINGNKVGIHTETRAEFKMITEYDDNNYLVKKEIKNLKGIQLLTYNKKDNIHHEYYDDGTLYRNTKVINGRMYQSFYLGDEQSWISKEVVKEKEYDHPGASYNHKRVYNKPLLFNRIDCLGAKFHIAFIERFCEFLLKDNEKEATLFFIEMMRHKDLIIQNRGAYYAGELKNAELIPQLEQFIANKKSKRIILPDRFAEIFGGSQEFYATSKIAKESLKKIKNSHDKK